MARSAGQKLKLLYIIRLLTENTDENHPVSTADIIAYLESNGIRSERKSIYDDIEKLCDFGSISFRFTAGWGAVIIWQAGTLNWRS